MSLEEVILVNESDQEIGTMEKLEAHKKGALHRAFSVLLFDQSGKMLIQKRANCKYHSPDLWSNACCSHPRPGENIDHAVKRRLVEELGIDASTSEHKYSFQYKVNFGNGLIEHELDHVFVGTTEQEPILNPEEVSEYRYMSVEELKEKMKQSPEEYTYWFRMIMNRLPNDD